MNFEKVENVVYKRNILFEVTFQARFPEIKKILQEVSGEFRDALSREGYPEVTSDVPVLPAGMPKELGAAARTSKIFRFLSEEKNWRISLSKDFIALTCSGNYKHYIDFREKLEKALQIFDEIYCPDYFNRIGLIHKNIANRISLPYPEHSIETYAPKHIFPELETPIAADTEVLQKVSVFNDGNVKANVVHLLSNLSGQLGAKKFVDEKSYLIEIDCYFENKTEGIENVLAKCDTLKQLNRDIFQWSITDTLRAAMERTES